ncbi:MAG: NAD(+) diphosphatase [Bosea sp. (in: a-proteobacteria)]
MADGGRVHRAELSARVGYASFALDRRAAWRDDAARIEALFGAPDAMTVVVAGEMPILLSEGDNLTVWHRPAEIASVTPLLARIFLGTVDGSHAPRFAVAVSPDLGSGHGAHPGHVVNDLRSIAMQGLVPPDQLACLGAGKALVDWHMRHGFCARCGGRTSPAQGGWRRDCAACGAQHFPRTDPVAIMLAVRGEYCLLARQSRFPPGMFSCLAGFIEPGETMEDAVRRETQEEAGIRVGSVRYLAAQPWPFPSSLMIGCIAEALDETLTLDGTELEDGRWFTREEARLMLKKQHPQGLFCPPRSAIANTLLWAWAMDGLTP